MSLNDADLRAMLVERARGEDPRAAELRLQAILRSIVAAPPRRRSWRDRLTLPGPGSVTPRTALVGVAAAVIVVAAIAIAPFSPRPQPGAGGSVSPTPPASESPSVSPSPPTPGVAASPAPHVPGTCPVTPITDVAAGVAPEVVTSGLRWRWAGLPWQAGVGQKLVLIGPAAATGALRLVATRLDFPAGTAPSPDTAQYVFDGGGPSWAGDVGLPAGGCWLLTAVADGARGSVVVLAGAPPRDPPDPATQHVPTVHVAPSTPLACPASPQQSGAAVRTYLDGAAEWQDPDPRPWSAGRERTLVVYGVRAPDPDERAVIVRVSDVSGPSMVDEPARFTKPAGGIPPAFGVAVPSAGCWAVTYLNPFGTSTIVVPVAGS